MIPKKDKRENARCPWKSPVYNTCSKRIPIITNTGPKKTMQGGMIHQNIKHTPVFSLAL